MYYREYERMEARLTSAKGKRLKKRRSAVVEPVTVRRRGRELTELFWNASDSWQR